MERTRQVFPDPGCPNVENTSIQELVEPHVASFDYFLTENLPKMVADMSPVEVEIPHLQQFLKFWVDEVSISTPCKDTYDDKLYPFECREYGMTYGAPFFVTITRQITGKGPEKLQKLLGRLPIMVKSSKCHLRGLKPAELVERHEEHHEMGGYFIVNGLEKLIRLLIVPRANNAVALKQKRFMMRGKNYTQFGVEMRCLRADQTTLKNTIHYLNDGNCTLRFSLRKQEFFIPVVILMKAMMETTDREIYEKLTQGDSNNTFVTDRVELMLRESKGYGVQTRTQCLSYLGSHFRHSLDASSQVSDIEVGKMLIQRYVLVHLSTQESKFNLLIFLIRKLYSLVSGEIAEDNQDSQSNHDILLPGHLYAMIVKEKIQEWLVGIKLAMLKDIRRGLVKDYSNETYFKKLMEKNSDIGQRLQYFLSTGNLISSSGLDLMQKTGFCIVGERINYIRYISHFRGIHRGQFFTTMKTTKVRKLLPDGWGFLCPVHTPDGSPCGLLNHLALHCKVVTSIESNESLPALLASLGMNPIISSVAYPSTSLPVLLNGEIIGYVFPNIAVSLVRKLRLLKANGEKDVPKHLEIVLIDGKFTRQFPCILLFSNMGRMTRPVRYLPTDTIEWVCSMEQAFMHIACTPDDIIPGKTLHAEISPLSMLSLASSLTPFSDFNQSPRNMYQCQMSKQTMATPFHAYIHRTDNKLYRLQTPQSPIVRNRNHTKYSMDDYPTGTNAVVAVISYTGYDMEDAMIINKSAHDRGFGHGTVYKSDEIDLTDRTARGDEYFYNPIEKGKDGAPCRFCKDLDKDGLPYIGQLLNFGDPYVCTVNMNTKKAHVRPFKGKEPSYIDQIRILDIKSENKIRKIIITLRINRNPIIGDKFSSRHGQKGVLSQLWPTIDMPFTESGMTPDVIINPHAFPSRMTIGMLVESMAGKSGSLHGIFQDSTPFQFDEKQRAIDYFGEQLLKAGYNYYGNEPMYSGVSGTVMEADIFFGVVFYQRLRHMVSDKYQVRSTGPNHNLTHQPVKGRKMGGGIRLGEMERDSLLAHGAAFFLHDRLQNCSDSHKAYVCGKCGSLISPVFTLPSAVAEKQVICRYCDTGVHIRLLNLPFVFRYLAAELFSMNIRMSLTLRDAVSEEETTEDE